MLTRSQLSRIAAAGRRRNKVQTCIRLDAEVVAWLKRKGARNWTTRASEILRLVMEADKGK